MDYTVTALDWPVMLSPKDYFADTTSPKKLVYRRFLREMQRELCTYVYNRTGKNMSAAARVLGINVNTLRKILVNCGADIRPFDRSTQHMKKGL